MADIELTDLPGYGNDRALVVQSGLLEWQDLATQTELNTKQATLVSGTNIKTLNGNTLLGSGDLVIDSEFKDLVGKPIYDIRDYGALIDGTTNDGAAVQAAIEAAKLTGGGIIYFPAGRTIIATAVNVDTSTLKGSYLLTGEAGKSLVTFDGGINTGIGIGNATLVKYRDLVFTGKVTGSSSANSTDVNLGFYHGFCNLLEFENCLIIGMKATTAVIFANSCRLSIKNCNISGCVVTGGGVISTTSSAGFVIRESFFVDGWNHGGIDYNKIPFGSTKHWILMNSPISLASGSISAGISEEYFTSIDCYYDENTTDCLINLTATTDYSAYFKNTQFNGGISGGLPPVKINTLGKLKVENCRSGYGTGGAFDSFQLTDVANSEFVRLVHRNDCDNVAFLGTPGRAKFRDCVGVSLDNAIGTVIDWNNNKMTNVANTNYTAVLDDDMIIYTSLSGSSKTVTLPTAVGIKGKEYLIIDGAGAAGTFNITVDGAGSETINGATTSVINSNYGKVRIKSNGTGWLII